MPASGGNELGIGLQDLKNAKGRLHNPNNGLNEQIEFNQKLLELRVVASFFALLIMGTLLSWMVGMPPLIKYGFTSAAVLALMIYFIICIRRRRNLEKLRDAQLREHIESKATK
ncbi:MAG: hypothetical protein ACPF9K_04570 [Neptuniibacter sp.]